MELQLHLKWKTIVLLWITHLYTRVPTSVPSPTAVQQGFDHPASSSQIQGMLTK